MPEELRWLHRVLHHRHGGGSDAGVGDRPLEVHAGQDLRAVDGGLHRRSAAQGQEGCGVIFLPSPLVGEGGSTREAAAETGEGFSPRAPPVEEHPIRRSRHLLPQGKEEECPFVVRRRELSRRFLRPTPRIADRNSVREMATMNSTLSTRSKCLVAAAVAAVLAVLGSPTGAAVRAQDRSPVIDLSSGNAEMNAAIAKGRATLPTFWASYDAPKPSETGHSLKVRFANPRNNGEHIWMADVKKTADGRYSGRFANAPRDLPGKKAGEVALFKRSRHLGLDVHAERQDRRRRDHQAAAESHCRRPMPMRFGRGWKRLERAAAAEL